MLLQLVSRDGEIVLSGTRKPEQMRDALSRLFAHTGVDPADAAESANGDCLIKRANGRAR